MDRDSNLRTRWLVNFISIIAPIAALANVGVTSFLFSNGPIPILLTLLAAGFAAYKLARMETDNQDDLRGKIDRLFSSLSVKAQDERFAFEGSRAEVIQDDDPPQGRYSVTIKRLARNPHGEYYWMILEADAKGARLVHIKHVAHNAARAILGARYIPPSLHGAESAQPVAFSDGKFVSRASMRDGHLD